MSHLRENLLLSVRPTPVDNRTILVEVTDHADHIRYLPDVSRGESLYVDDNTSVSKSLLFTRLKLRIER